MSYGIIPGKPLDSILESTARINIWSGPVRSAKTIHSLIRWCEYVHTAPQGGELIMVGKTEDTLERNVFKPLEVLLGGDFSYSKGSHTWRIGKRTGFSIGANDEKAEGKVRGVTSSGAYIDEGTLIPSSFIRQMLARLSVKGSKLFLTTNSDNPYHHLKKDFIDRAHELDLKHFTWSLETNTFLDPAYVAALKLEYTGLWYKRFILGQWVVADGAVYDFWDEEKHTIFEPPKADFKILSVDYGTSNATAAGLYGVCENPKPGAPRCWLEREYYHSGRDTGHSKTDGEYASELLEFLGKDTIRYVLLDPSAASFKTELRRRGVTVREADNDVLNGIRTQAQMLYSGAYKVCRAATQTIRDYGAYMWDSKASARGEDKPIKQNDHTKDHERYMLHTHFSKQSAPENAFKLGGL